MGRINNLCRRRINKKNRSRLENHDITVFSSNCNGAFILHDLGLRFNSPFVNLYVKPDDYLRFLQKPKHYLACELKFIKDERKTHPIALLDDITIYFEHYSSEEEARTKWIDRSKRVSFDNLFIMFTDRDGCTYQNLLDFDALPYKNKVVFTHLPYPEIKSAFYLKGWEKEQSVGICSYFINKISGKRYYDSFDYVSWFNQKL